jgi:hypothetical protein
MRAFDVLLRFAVLSISLLSIGPGIAAGDSLTGGQQSVKAPDPWAPIRVFEGEWKGTSEGEPGMGTVQRSYEFVLSGRYLYERNISTYPPQERNPKGEVHHHWSFFSYDKSRKQIVLRQFHMEGFVNQYVLNPALSTPKRLVFDSESFENFNSTWKARETYDIASPTEIVETFELAPPEKPLQVYSRNRLKRSSP